MLEILGLVFGAVARLAPTVISFFKEGRDLKYEVVRLDKEIELERQRGANAQAEIAATSAATVDASWAGGLVEAIKGQAQVTGDKWLDRLNVSVRPILTYWWCIVVYTGNKILLATVALQEKAALAQLAPIIYGDFDRAVVGSIIGFWFVDRSLRQGGQK